MEVEHDPKAIELVAKWVQAIVSADRWKGRSLTAEPPEKWHRLRTETQQFWIEEGIALLDALAPYASPLSAAWMQRQAVKIIDPGYGDFHAGYYNQIAAIPSPTPAELLADALRLPEVAWLMACLGTAMPSLSAIFSDQNTSPKIWAEIETLIEAFDALAPTDHTEPAP